MAVFIDKNGYKLDNDCLTTNSTNSNDFVVGFNIGDTTHFAKVSGNGDFNTKYRYLIGKSTNFISGSTDLADQIVFKVKKVEKWSVSPDNFGSTVSAISNAYTNKLCSILVVHTEQGTNGYNGAYNKGGMSGTGGTKRYMNVLKTPSTSLTSLIPTNPNPSSWDILPSTERYEHKGDNVFHWINCFATGLGQSQSPFNGGSCKDSLELYYFGEEVTNQKGGKGGAGGTGYNLGSDGKKGGYGCGGGGGGGYSYYRPGYHGGIGGSGGEARFFMAIATLAGE